MIDLLNTYFVPVYIRNGDYSESGTAPAEEKAERTRIYRDSLAAGLAAGSVCAYLLSPDARPLAVAPLNQTVATDPGRLADLMEQVVEDLKVAKGKPLVTPAPQSSPPSCEPDSLILHLTARYLHRQGNELTRIDNASVLGSKKGGNWADLPSEEWIVLRRDEWAKLLPERAEVGTSWELDRGTTAKILRHFYPPTENTATEENQLDEQTLVARIESIESSIARVRIDGSLKMKHTFYHKDDDNFVNSTLVGFLDFDTANRRIEAFQLVTNQAEYGNTRSRQFFGVAVRLVR